MQATVPRELCVLRLSYASAREDRLLDTSDNMNSLDLPSRLLGRIIHPHARS